MEHSPFRKALLISAALELASFSTWYQPTLRWPSMILLAGIAVFLAWKDLKSLFALLLIEMAIGSHGHLLFIETASGSRLTVRMLLFALLVIGWCVKRLFSRAQIPSVRTDFGRFIFWPLGLVAVSVAWGVARGLMNGNGFGAVIADANAYAFMLLVPIAADLLSDRAVFARATQIFAGALTWLSIKSLALLYFFSHEFGPILSDLFLWQRRYWLTEITGLGDGGWHRVFAASDLFLIPGVLAGFMIWWSSRERRLLSWLVPCTAAFYLSFSRSFMLGALVAVIAVLPVLVRSGAATLKSLPRFFLYGLSLDALGLLLIGALVYFPVPALRGSAGLDAFGDRLFGQDAAVSSRWNMLPALHEEISRSPILGSGFGKAITYVSDDPRIISLHEGGRITTPAVEWQYLEIWMKMGFIGVVAFAWFLWRFGRRLLAEVYENDGSDRILAAAALMSFIAFVVLNVFTPYLNHPLGWMFLALIASLPRSRSIRS